MREVAEDTIFYRFVEEMNQLLRASEVDGKDQRSEIAKMVGLERRFRATLLSTKQGYDVYRAFITYIMEVKGNVLSAQVFFRERQAAFHGKTERVFYDNKPLPLCRFRINYLFARWAVEHYLGPHKDKLLDLIAQLTVVRNGLIENNLPLAINRSKRFWYKVPESHLQYMDHIQSAAEGLTTAIDKFVPDDGAFAHVAVGRITLNLSTEQSATQIKFSPKEKRILYRINMAKYKEGLTNIDDIVRFVNESFKGVTARDVINLSTASGSLASIDEKDLGGNSILDTARSSQDTGAIVEAADLSAKLKMALSRLSVVERKIVRLRNGYR